MSVFIFLSCLPVAHATGARRAPMSGGLAATGRRGARGITRSAQALARKNGDTPRVACLGLDGEGVADPELTEMKKGGVWAGAKRRSSGDAETGLKGQPQERRGRRHAGPTAPGEAFNIFWGDGHRKAGTRH